MSRHNQEARRELREVFWYPLGIAAALVVSVAALTTLALKLLA